MHRAGPLAETAWLNARQASRACYATQPAPGDAIGAGDAFRRPADEAAIAAGRANFCAVEIVVDAIETLYLLHDGHRRARFALGPRDGSPRTATWLVP